jgi:hypothetical protein
MPPPFGVANASSGLLLAAAAAAPTTVAELPRLCRPAARGTLTAGLTGHTLTKQGRHLDVYLKAKSLVPAVPASGRGVCGGGARAGLSGAPSILWKATGIGFSSYASRHSMCSIVWPFCSSCEELRDCRLNVDLVRVAQKASKF